MKKTLYIILFIFSVESYGQAFLNGSFENNTAIDDETNLLNIDYNSYMSNSIGFGYLPALNLAGNLDILTSSSYCGGAQNGNWYVGLTSGGSDAFSLELSSPLIIGNSYSMSFYDRSCSPGQGEAIQIGVSETNNNFENLVYSAPTPINNVGWTLRTFTFIAPIDGLFITVKCNGIDTHEGFWTNVDNFSIDCSINLNLGGDTTLCQGESLTLDATTTNATYFWKGDSTRSTLNVTEQGDYWVKVTLGNCSISDTINVNFISKPTIDLGNDTTVCLGESVILNATTPNATYLWQNNSTNPTLNIILQGTYWVEAKNNCGIDSDTINVDLESCICILYIPNSFTPNFDNTNDQFSPLFDCDITEYSFLIFNRFGELIFETNTQNSSWHGDFNGELCPTGIYIYLIKYKYEGSYQKKYGHVGLLK